jgi:hypothetical protein
MAGPGSSMGTRLSCPAVSPSPTVHRTRPPAKRMQILLAPIATSLARGALGIDQKGVVRAAFSDVSGLPQQRVSPVVGDTKQEERWPPNKRRRCGSASPAPNDDDDDDAEASFFGTTLGLPSHAAMSCVSCAAPMSRLSRGMRRESIFATPTRNTQRSRHRDVKQRCPKGRDRRVEVLRSTAAAAIDDTSSVPGKVFRCEGGGTQLFTRRTTAFKPIDTAP